MSENDTKDTKTEPVSNDSSVTKTETNSETSPAVVSKPKSADSQSETKVDDSKVNEVAETTQTASLSSPSAPAKSTNWKFIVGAVVVVVVVILAVLYRLEQEGRSSTNLFGGIIASQEAGQVVAEVNGVELTNGDLATSMEQFSQMAAAQGVDTTSESVQADIRSQSLDVLINTELLIQEANGRDIEVSEEEVTTRIEDIVTQLGGQEQLDERMASLGIDAAQLESDVREEILIQSLLDEVFAEEAIEITDEEISAVYEGVAESTEDIPALAEVRSEIEAQLRAAREQEIVDGLISDLRDGADIQIVE
jgi:hypothetical protein